MAGPDRPTHRRPALRRAVVVAMALIAWVLLSAAGIVTLQTLRRRGAVLTGDEPSYLISALGLGRFHTLQVAQANLWFFQHHSFPETGIPAVVSNRYSLHDLGLSAILAGPVLVSVSFAVHFLIVLEAGLFVLLALAVWRTFGRDAPWPILVLVIVVTPGTLVALTQVYPDLLSGLIIAIVLMVLIGVERGRDLSAQWWFVIGLALGILPWIHVKNVIATIVIGVTVLWLLFRSDAPRAQARARSGLVALGAIPVLVVLLVYNEVAYRTVAGPPSQVVVFTKATLTRGVGLLFDQQHGLFIQQPALLIGVAGLIVAVRRTPIVATGSVVIVLGLWVANAGLTNSYGGISAVGRLEWELIPILGAFAGLYLTKLRMTRATFARGIVFVCALVSGAMLVIFFAVPYHSIYNGGDLAWVWHRGEPFGWWPSFTAAPCLSASCFVHPWSGARPWWSVVFVTGVSGAVVALLVSLESRRFARMLRVVALSGAVAAVVALVSLHRIELPTTPPNGFQGRF